MNDEEKLKVDLYDVYFDLKKKVETSGNLCKSAHNDLKWCVSHINRLETAIKEILTTLDQHKETLNKLIRNDQNS